MSRGSKRKGGAIEAPPTKKSNKENSLLSSQQRRSSRNRCGQKTPLQQLEEISSVVSGLALPNLNSKSTSVSILEDSMVNPMAPGGTTKRSYQAAKPRSEKPSVDPSVLRPATLTVPSIDMQQFAAMATGNTVTVGSDSTYNLLLPSAYPSGTMPTAEASSQVSPVQDGQLFSTASQCADGRDSLTGNGNNAVLAYDSSLGPQLRSEPSLTSGIMFNGAGDAEGYYAANATAPDAVYDWLQERQGSSSSAPPIGHSEFLEGTTSHGSAMNASPAFYGGLDWIDTDGYLSNGAEDREPEDTDDELSDTSEEEALVDASATQSYFDNGLVTLTGTTNSLSGNMEGINHGSLQNASVTTASSLQNALGPSTSSGTINGSAQNTPVTSGETPMIQKRLAPVAIPQEEHLVLEAHHKRNRRPRPPTAERLSTAGIAQPSSAGTNPRPILRPAATDTSISHIRHGIDSVTRPVPTGSRGTGGSSRNQQSTVTNGRGNGINSGSGTSLGTTQVGQSNNKSDSDSDSDDGESEIDVAPRTRAPRYSKTARESKPVEPDKLEYYPPNWQAVLKLAKWLLRRWIAIQLPFPNKRQHYYKMLEFINRALEIHQSGGGYVEEGFYQEHRQGMMKLLWDEIANFRGGIKLYAREAILGYGFIPEGITDKELYKATLIANVRGWANDAFFLRNGVDANGSTNNFAHPLFRQTLMAAFYSSLSKLAAHFPEDFYFETPRQAMALVATAMLCAFDEWLGGKRETLKFSGDQYAPKLVDMLDLMANLEADPVQAAKLQTLRRTWARMGRNDHEDQPVNNGFAVAL